MVNLHWFVGFSLVGSSGGHSVLVVCGASRGGFSLQSMSSRGRGLQSSQHMGPVIVAPRF